ncbi:Hypothetical predicted protein, partial [Mytilus galloprovincialis]
MADEVEQTFDFIIPFRPCTRTDDEYKSNLHTMTRIVIYTKRWWILLIFSFNCITQSLIWNTWGPITQSAKAVFLWKDATIGMIANCSNISTLVTVYLASYGMDYKGDILCVMNKYTLIINVYQKENYKGLEHISFVRHLCSILTRKPPRIVIYTRRWWILLIFSFNCITQTLIWNTWGPIAQSAKAVFIWNDATVGMIANCSNISTLFTVFLASYFMDYKDTRSFRIYTELDQNRMLKSANEKKLNEHLLYALYLFGFLYYFDLNVTACRNVLLHSNNDQFRKCLLWWMLAVFSFSCFMQTLIWNTWGPIAQSAKTVYGWSDGTIGLIPSLGNIACMCTVLLNCYFMDEKGLRISAVLCSGLIFAASGLRCITSDPEYATGL